MKCLRIVLVYITILLMLGCAGPSTVSPAEPEFKQEIGIINDSPIKVVVNVNRMFCKIPNYGGSGDTAYLRECPKFTGEVNSGKAFKLDVTNSHEYTFPVEHFEDKFFFYITIYPSSQVNRDRVEFSSWLIAFEIGKARLQEVHLKDLMKMKYRGDE